MSRAKETAFLGRVVSRLFSGRRRANFRRPKTLDSHVAALEVLEERRVLVTVTVSTSFGEAEEGTGGYIYVSIGEYLPDPVTVYFTLTGSATEGDDYVDLGDSVVIPAYTAVVALDFTPIEDHEAEPTETVKITLLADPAYTLGATWQATMGILQCNNYAGGPTPVFPPCPTCSTLTAGDVVNKSANPTDTKFVWPGLFDDQGFVAPGSLNPTVAKSPPWAPGVAASFGAPGFSSHPVRYGDGVVAVASLDLQSEGAGIPWGLTRSWTNAQAVYRNNVVGTRWLVTEQPFMGIHDTTEYYVFSNAYTFRRFNLVDDEYIADGFAQESLIHDDEEHEYIYTDTEGGVIRFYDFTSNHPALQQGQFKSFTDADGNTVEVVDHTTEGRIEEVQLASTVSGVTVTESYLYTYITTLINDGLLDHVIQRRKVDSGSWTTIRQAYYDYYGKNEDYGNRDNLKTATIKDGSGNVLDETYYRYYKPAEANGFANGLMYVVYPASLARLIEAEGSDLDAIADEDLAPYADHYFEFDSYLKATAEVAQGAGCSTCNGGQGEFEYAYTTGFASEEGYNTWRRKTVETLPDGNQNIVYTNYQRQVMLQVYKDTTTNEQWATYYRYDSSGRVLFRADPSAVSGYNDSYRSLVKSDSEGTYSYLRDNEGLITDFTYYATTTADSDTPGGAAGYLESVSIRQGETGAAISQGEQTYLSRTAGDTTIYVPAEKTVYANEDGTGAQTTEFAYTFFTDTVQVESITTTDPSAAETTVYFDALGRPVWNKDQEGYINYVAYDQKTGAVVKSITDVDTSETSDFTGKPSGWTTPGSGGLHLISTAVVDAHGRPTKQTDANGNVTYTSMTMKKRKSAFIPAGTRPATLPPALRS